jgi:2,3-bisphosphoglycerate-dependent phosphoglycerate mutase
MRLHNPEIYLTLLRHGRSKADDEGIYEGRYDSPLTDTGRAQALRRAEAWQAQGVRFDRIICSPLRRAHETAQIIGAALGADVEADPDWMEWDHGMLAGLPRAEADARYPRPAFLSPHTRRGVTGETAWECYSRAARAVEKIVHRGPAKYLVVAHGGILNQALHSIFGISPQPNHYGAWFAFGDNGYLHLRYQPDQHCWHVLEFNSGFVDS